MILKMSVTLAECITTVVVPAAVASSAAMSFVDMPPVPRDVPRVEVDTCCFTFSMSRTTLTGFASGLLRGLSVYKQSTSVKRKR